jgi:hypothetical protein
VGVARERASRTKKRDEVEIGRSAEREREREREREIDEGWKGRREASGA